MTPNNQWRDAWFIVGGEPNGNGGGVIDSSSTRFYADRLAALYVAKGYRDVKVISYDDFVRDC